MADVPFDPTGIAEVRFLTTVAVVTAPTVAEFNAGTRCTGYITDGPPSPSGATFLPSGALDSRFNSQVASLYGGGSGTMTIRRIRDTTTTDDTADTIYNLLPQGTVGWFAVAVYGVSGAAFAAAVGDTIDLIPVEVANRTPVTARGALAVGTIELAFNNEVLQQYDLAA